MPKGPEAVAPSQDACNFLGRAPNPGFELRGDGNCSRVPPAVALELPLDLPLDHVGRFIAAASSMIEDDEGVPVSVDERTQELRGTGSTTWIGMRMPVDVER